jgi:general nucleoside transport system permease protein
MTETLHPTTRPTLIFRAKRMVPTGVLEAVGISTAAIAISLLLFGVFVLFSRVNPLQVYYLLYRGAFGTEYSWRSTMLQAAPLMLTALCVVVPARVGMIIIGGEGCVVLGGLIAALTAHLMPGFSPMAVKIGMIVAGMTVGGLWIAFCGALRQYRGVNEVISSLLLNYIAIAIMNHCVEGPMHDPASLNHPSSWPIGAANMLGNIPGTQIHWGLVYGLVACVFCWILLDHTTHGFATNIVGGNVRAARISGISIAKFSLIACFIGGAAAALAGVVEVAAVQGQASDALVTGYGYAGILVAFVARQNALAVIPVAILLGGVAGSGDLLQAQLGISSASVQVFQGILFLVILSLDTWSGRLGEVRNAWFARPFVRLLNLVMGRSARAEHATANT